MALAILGGISTLLGIGGQAAQLHAVQTAGQAQQKQAAQMLNQNMDVQKKLGQNVQENSEAAMTKQAAAANYSLAQSARITTAETNLRLASQWSQVLSGNGAF